MTTRQRRKSCLYITLAVIGLGIILNVANFGTQIFGEALVKPACLDDSRITFNESGVIDTISQWRKLGLATYIFTSYLDDREPCSPMLTVMGFGEKSESPISGTLLLHNGLRMTLGEYEERRKLNPTGGYSIGKLGPYAYLWPLLGEVTTNHLRSILLQQSHIMTGNMRI